MPMIYFRCKQCTLVYEVLHHERHNRHGGGILVERMRTHDESDDWQLCPCCGSDEIVETLGGVGNGIALGGEAGVGRRFPYFDHGMGVWVKSQEHRREQYKAHGLIPTEGETKGLWDELADKERAEREDDERKWAATQRELEEGPNRAAYMGVRDAAAQQEATARERERKIAEKGRERAMEIRERQAWEKRRKSHADR